MVAARRAGPLAAATGEGPVPTTTAHEAAGCVLGATPRDVGLVRRAPITFP